jgi:hypothetical protein
LGPLRRASPKARTYISQFFERAPGPGKVRNVCGRGLVMTGKDEKKGLVRKGVECL